MKSSLKKKLEEESELMMFMKEHLENIILTSCIIESGYIDNYDLDIPRYNELFEGLSKAYDHDQLFKSVRYLCEHSKRTNKKIENKYKFFEGVT